MSVASEVLSPTATEDKPDPGERCDRCIGEAVAVVRLRTGPLTFCSHHARQYAEALEPLLVSERF